MDPWNDNPKKSPWGDNKNQSVPDIEELLTNLQNKFKFKGGGGGGLFTQSRMQRYWRDINAGAMHITMNWDVIGAFSGRIALGLPPDSDQF